MFSLEMLNPKVGTLFNLPAGSSRGEALDYISEAEVEAQVEAVRDALTTLGFQYRLLPLNDVSGLVGVLEAYKPDVVVNLCEGAFGDSHQEMNVPSLLELLRMPYTGSSPLTLGLCQNKGLAKDVLRANGVPTPKYRVLKSFKEWEDGISHPLFVKPLLEDASLGVSRESFVRNDEELKKQVEYVNKQYKQPALVEEYVEGRELNVAILGNDEPLVLPISEIIFEFSEEPRIVGYSAKWIKESDEYEKTKASCPANLEPFDRDKVERVALKAYRVLHCRDYGRVDIRLKGGEPYVLEVNPNPDISLEAGFARSLKAAGIPFEEFVKRIICYALGRVETPNES